MNQNKTILIVDDVEVDREILKEILNDYFTVIEAANGEEALKIIQEQAESLKAIMLDIVMPNFDGFSVLESIKDKKAGSLPVFLITSEATRDNVSKAMQFNVAGIIRKPFDRETILHHLSQSVGGIAYQLSVPEILETRKYIKQLELSYNTYLDNFGKDAGHWLRVVELMKILLRHYAEEEKGAGLDDNSIEVIAGAAYFCNIGDMVCQKVLRKDGSMSDSDHTFHGANIIRFNYSFKCSFFVSVCAEMCLQHHERFDGTGFPNRLAGNEISVYAQMVRLCEDFDENLFRYGQKNIARFDFIAQMLAEDEGAYDRNMLWLLNDCKLDIAAYYRTLK
ncbi:MAG: response regulator [Treponemataceae bacterium]|nr:response regulator [Treponemataceae bacterium]